MPWCRPLGGLSVSACSCCASCTTGWTRAARDASWTRSARTCLTAIIAVQRFVVQRCGAAWRGAAAVSRRCRLTGVGKRIRVNTVAPWVSISDRHNLSWRAPSQLSKLRTARACTSTCADGLRSKNSSTGFACGHVRHSRDRERCRLGEVAPSDQQPTVRTTGQQRAPRRCPVVEWVRRRQVVPPHARWPSTLIPATIERLAPHVHEQPPPLVRRTVRLQRCGHSVEARQPLDSAESNKFER